MTTYVEIPVPEALSEAARLFWRELRHRQQEFFHERIKSGVTADEQVIKSLGISHNSLPRWRKNDPNFQVVYEELVGKLQVLGADANNLLYVLRRHVAQAIPTATRVLSGYFEMGEPKAVDHQRAKATIEFLKIATSLTAKPKRASPGEKAEEAEAKGEQEEAETGPRWDVAQLTRDAMERRDNNGR